MIDLKPSNVHDPIALTIGDDFVIVISCTNSNGTPLDMSTVSDITWKLVDPTTYTILFTLTIGTGITIAHPVEAGQCVVWLTKDQSATLAPDHYYQDQCRVTAAGILSTQSVGRIDTVAVS
jgi:hypothetical protein